MVTGDDIGLKLDLNYNFRTDGFIAIAKALSTEALGGGTGMDWLGPSHCPIYAALHGLSRVL